MFPLNEEGTAYTVSLAGAINHLNTTYLLSIRDSQMSEEAWDALTAHLSLLERVAKSVQEEYFN